MASGVVFAFGIAIYLYIRGLKRAFWLGDIYAIMFFFVCLSYTLAIVGAGALF
jgi:hypothetical protein